MDGSFLRFYVHEKQRSHGVLTWEWILQQANKLGIRGGSAFRAMAGFGRHHQLHEENFFELAGSQTIEVEFIVTGQEAQQLFDLLRRERIRVFHTQVAVRFGVVNPDDEDAEGRR